MVKIMGFMERQITIKRKWYEIETNCGTWFVDVEDVTAESSQSL